MKKLIRFLITGGSAAIIEYLLFLILFKIIGENFLSICQSVSFIGGFIVSFTLNKKWVFKSDGNSKKELIKYTFLASINLILSNLMLYILVDKFKIIFYISKIFVMGLIATWNYLIYQKIVFIKKSI